MCCMSVETSVNPCMDVEAGAQVDIIATYFIIFHSCSLLKKDSIAVVEKNWAVFAAVLRCVTLSPLFHNI